jgi:hypothetical protein
MRPQGYKCSNLHDGGVSQFLFKNVSRLRRISFFVGELYKVVVGMENCKTEERIILTRPLGHPNHKDRIFSEIIWSSSAVDQLVCCDEVFSLPSDVRTI